MNNLRVYVAASSDELDRASAIMRAIETIPGATVTHDWVTVIHANGGVANPGQGHFQECRGWALEAKAGVTRANMLWLLAPNAGHARGAFVELGIALDQGKQVIVSGPARRCSIFTALADSLFDTDVDAFEYLRTSFGGEG